MARYKIGIGRHRFKPQFNLVEETTLIINGIAKWAKVIGPAQPAYDKTKREWSLDLYITKETVKKLEAEKLGPKVKDKGEGPFIKFTKGDTKKDGSPAKPIRIVGPGGAKDVWDGKLIGNGSEVNVSFVVNEREYNGQKFWKPGIVAIQVVKHVAYEGGDYEDFEPVDGHEEESWT